MLLRKAQQYAIHKQEFSIAREVYTLHTIHSLRTTPKSKSRQVQAPPGFQAQTLQPHPRAVARCPSHPQTPRETYPYHPTTQPHNNNHPPGHLTSQSHTPPQHIPPKSRRQCSAARSRPPCADRSTRVSVPLQPLRRHLPSPSAHSLTLLVSSIPLGVPGRPSASPAAQSSVP